MGPAEGQILKLTLVGFMAELQTPFLQAGDKIEVTFELPVTKKLVKEQCVVIKLYNQWRPQEESSPGPETLDASANTPAPIPIPGHKPGTVQHIAEIHFKPLTQAGKSAINEFLRRLHGSTPPSA